MKTSMLFGDDPRPVGGAPLADRMRPARLDEVLGQGHLLGAGRPLRIALDRGHLHSFILWVSTPGKSIRSPATTRRGSW